MRKITHSIKIAGSTGIFLSIGFVLTIIGSWLFFGMLIGVVFTHQINMLDIEISNFLNRFRTPQLTAFFQDFTDVGSWGVAIIGFIVAVLCLAYRKWFLSSLWITSLIGGYALNIFIKSLVQRPRPTEALISGYGFPSGHAMMSTVAYGMLCYYILLFINNQFERVTITCLFTGLILLIGFSR
ncbi:MAG: phosphatase PAP2 family protein, partial [Fibrobacter sp.]|nr:phosphatase PAP2 family protein [Fibrobacter sp.]